MSDRRGQAADLTTESFRLDQSSVPGDFADSLSDTSAHFEAWLAELKPARESQKNLAPQGPMLEAAPAGGFKFQGRFCVAGSSPGVFPLPTATVYLKEARSLRDALVVHR